MNKEADSSNTAIVTAWIALVGAVVAAVFSAYTTIVVSNEKHSVERAELFTKLLAGLDSTEGTKSRLALLNLWQLYPNEHKVIVLASLEIGHSELVETMIRLDDEIKPYQGFLMVQAKSKNQDVAASAKRIIEQLDPEEAAKIYIDELMASRRVAIGDERVDKLIALIEDFPDVKNVIVKAKRVWPASPILEYILYKSAADKSWFESEMNASRIDELSDILCCGEIDAADQLGITEIVLKSIDIDNLSDSDKFTVSHVVNYLNNPSLQPDRMSTNLGHVVRLSKTIVGMDGFYNLARANALHTLATSWSPANALRLIADRLSHGESDELVRLEMAKLLDDSYFKSLAAEAIGLSAEDMDSIPTVDDNPEKWVQWRDTVLAGTT
jgi:hypothetical protein